jgi:hypothetical protein
MAPRAKKPEPSTNLSFDFDPQYAELFAQLRDLIRGAGHARPSQKTLVQALIHHAPRNGSELELEVLVPYRIEHTEAE